MKIFRFMSKKEFEKYKNGEILKNNTKHSGFTDSVGFCFMNIEDVDPEDAYEFLSGIVSDDICVVFETDKKMKKSWGQYADPYGSFFDTIVKTEYCTNQYSIDDFKLLKVGYPPIFSWDFDKWKWSNS